MSSDNDSNSSTAQVAAAPRGSSSSSSSCAASPSSSRTSAPPPPTVLAEFVSELTQLTQKKGNLDTVLRLLYSVLKGMSYGMLATRCGEEHPWVVAMRNWVNVVDSTRGVLDLSGLPGLEAAVSFLPGTTLTCWKERDPVLRVLAILKNLTKVWYAVSAWSMWVGSWGGEEFAKLTRLNVAKAGYRVCLCWFLMVLLGMITDAYEANQLLSGRCKMEAARIQKQLRELAIRTIKNLVDATMALNGMGAISIYGPASGGWAGVIPSMLGLREILFF